VVRWLTSQLAVRLCAINTEQRLPFAAHVIVGLPLELKNFRGVLLSDLNLATLCPRLRALTVFGGFESVSGTK